MLAQQKIIAFQLARATLNFITDLIYHLGLIAKINMLDLGTGQVSLSSLGKFPLANPVSNGFSCGLGTFTLERPHSNGVSWSQ